MKTSDKIEEIFSEGGPVSQNLPGYEARPEQLAMSRAVRLAILKERHLITEAGTGIGKSLAYLVPFILWSAEQGTRVVVSTYTKTLQQQLFEKDIPFLKEALGLKFNYCLSVGTRNYLCVRRLERSGQRGFFDSKAEENALDEISEWRMRTDTGLFSELEFEIGESLKGRICRESDLCMGNKCPHQDECFFRRAKKREFGSSLIVANHHLFFANLSAGERLLPEYNAVVFDEAQNIEDVATSYLGLEVSNFRLKFLLDSISGTRAGRGLTGRLENPDSSLKTEVEKYVADSRREADLFFSRLAEKFPEGESTIRIRQPGIIENGLSGPLLMLSGRLRMLLEKTKDEEERLEISALSNRARSIADETESVVSQSAENSVYWGESVKGRRQYLILHSSPVDISGLMREKVFEKVRPVVLTSATLSVGGSFDFLRERLGIEGADEMMLGSPFNYRENALLYLPEGIPDPRQSTDDYTGGVINEVREILKITEGRTFVLFTSYRMLETVYSSLRDMPGIEILCQGTLPHYKMLEKFRKSLSGRGRRKGLVLFGTYTFWQGVDVPGSALECVIITKLPFAVPDDPVTEAKTELIQSQGRDPFASYHVPRAVVMLKQGFGRLVRTKEDRGMVAILDPRLRTRNYGKIFLESLPGCRTATDISEVREFFNELRS